MSYTPKPRGNIVESYEGIGDHVLTTNNYWLGLAINNDSQNDIIIIINNISIKVKANETFDDDFEDFSRIEIQASGNYRIVLRR